MSARIDCESSFEESERWRRREPVLNGGGPGDTVVHWGGGHGSLGRRRHGRRRRLAGLEHCVGVVLIRQDLCLPELGGHHLGADLVAVLAGNVPAHGVVARKGAVAEGTGHTDTLVTLANVGPQIGLVSVGALAEGALQLCT